MTSVPAVHLSDRGPLTAGLVMVITLAAFEALATATVMPAVKDDLGGVALYGWAFSAFLLASLVGITFAGEQADRHGPARPYAVGLALFATGLTIAGLAPAMWVLVIGRAVQGLGAGVIPPVAYVAVGRAYPEEARARIFALFATAWVVPGLVGPGLAGVTAEYLSWRLVFLAILPLVAAAALLVLPTLRKLGPPEVAPKAAPSGVPMAALLAVGFGAVLASFTLASPWFTPPLLLAGVVLAIPAVRRLMPAGTFKAGRGLPSTVLGIGALNLAFFGTDAFVPFMLTEVRDQSTVFVGAIFTASTLFWTAGTWVVERSKDRVSRQTFVGAGLILVAAGTLGQIAVLSQDVPVIFAGVTWSIGAFGIGIAYPSLSLLLLAQAPKGSEGTVTSSAKLAEALAAAVGAGVVGAIVNAGESAGAVSGSLAVSFVLMASVALVAVLLADRLPKRGTSIAAERIPAATPAGD
ncbi:MAG TPA: MFS transporter [Tepidiformaceae bacterium]|nr:MFS transporter [Tepidiformaceae bacterium]